jgi:hypothetical protein
MFRKTLYFPRLVANHFNTFEVSMIQNGGAEDTSFDYLKCAFNIIGPNMNYVLEKYNFNEIEYIIFQTSQPQRNTFYYDYKTTDGKIIPSEFRTYSNDTHERFYKWLVYQKRCLFDEWYLEHTKNWFELIKKELQIYESKGIKTLIINWETDYLKFYKEDMWMQERFIELEYDGKKYDCIRTMMNENIHLHINNDFENFTIPPKDHHPSKECHRVIADAVIKKIEETKDKKLIYEKKFI